MPRRDVRWHVELWDDADAEIGRERYDLCRVCARVLHSPPGDAQRAVTSQAREVDVWPVKVVVVLRSSAAPSPPSPIKVEAKRDGV